MIKKKYGLFLCIVMMLVTHTCTVKRDHPLDVHGESYIPPEITIDTSRSTILPDDTIHFDSGTIVLSEGNYPKKFRYRLSDTAWSEEQWQESPELHIDGLEDGTYTVTIQTSYKNLDDIVEEEMAFVVITFGYRPSFTDTSDSTIMLTQGNNLVIVVTPVGEAPFRFQWFKGESTFGNATDSALVFEELSTTDTGSYFCRVQNDYGTAVSRRFIVRHELRYNVTYDPNDAGGGEVPVDDSLYLEGEKVIAAGNSGELYRNGYSFAGWRTAKGENAVFYGVGAKIPVSDENMLLYAWWTKESVYSVTYHSNGASSGEVPEDDNEYVSGIGVTLLGNTGNLRKTNNDFIGWSRDTDPEAKLYLPDDTIMIGSADLSVFARWREILLYSVTYNANDADDGIVPVDATGYQSGEKAEVKGNEGVLSRSGYTFLGWNIAPDGTKTTYRESDSLEIDHDDIILYAQWTDNPTYTVTYNGNGAEDGVVPVDSRQYEKGEKVTVATNSGDLSVEGKTFTGWNTEKEGSTGISLTPNASFVMEDEDVILYARWTADPTYTVTYIGNGSTGGAVPAEVDNRAGVAINVAVRGSMVKTGHVFTGWSNSSDGGGTVYAPNDTFMIPEHDDTLYAQWEVTWYTVRYDGNGASVSGVPDSISNGYGEVIEISTDEPERTGYSFLRWNTSENGEGDNYRPGEGFEIPDKNVTLYAQWNRNQYIISYYGNENTGGAVPDSETVAYEDSITIAGRGDLVRTGHSFTGWNTSRNGSGTRYPADTTIRMGTDGLQLYAQWAINSYSVVFLKNDDEATETMSAQLIEYNAVAALSPNVFVKNGWSFTGWSTSPTGTLDYEDGSNYAMGYNDDTLYALWTINTHTVFFDKNDDDASGTMAQQTIAEGTSESLNANGFTKGCWTFVGWASEPSGTVVYSDGDNYTMGTDDETLYAVWELICPCDIYEENGTPCVAAYSTIRVLEGGYTGPLYQVRRTSDNEVTDIEVLPTGYANAARQDEFLGGGAGTISILYDQSGKGNDLTVAKKGCYSGTAGEDDFESDANGRPLTVGGHNVYALYMKAHDGYRSNQVGYAGYPDVVEPANGMPIGTEDQGIYMVCDGNRYGTACCWSFGNASTNNCYGPTGQTNTLFFGTAYWGKGDGSGPWFMNDMGTGIWAGGSEAGDPGWGGLGDEHPPNRNCPSMTMDYAFGISKTSTTDDTPYYCLRMANAQEGGTTVPDLVTAFDGQAPESWKMEGGIILGIGGDNSNSSFGTFFEGCITDGRPSDAADAAVLRNVRNARYGSSE